MHSLEIQGKPEPSLLCIISTFSMKIHTVRDKNKRNSEGKMSNLPLGNHTIVAMYLHIANGS